MNVKEAPAEGSKAPREPSSLRREARILLPVSLTLLLALLGFTLISYRGALLRLAEERRNDAARAARIASLRLADARGSSEDELRRAAPEARGAAVVDAEGRALVAIGDIPRSGLLGPNDGELPRFALGLGPTSGDAIVGLSPLHQGSAARAVRVDLDAALLASQLATQRVVTIVVLGIAASLLVLVLLFLRRFARPFATLLSQAQRVAAPESDDEITYLVRTFERAVDALSARREAEAVDELGALEKTLSRSLDSGLLLLDQEARVLALNPVGSELLAVPVPAPGAPLGEALAAHPKLVEILAAAAASGEAVRRREIALEKVMLGLSAHPLRRPNGALRGFLVLFTDLTEVRLRENEERLAAGLAQLGEMAAGVAHELRNSLATLGGYVSLAERRPGEVQSAGYLAEMRHEIGHIRRVVEDFLAFARPGTARPEEVDLAAVVARAAASATVDGGAVRVQPPGRPVRIMGDPQLLERALRNLLVNAVEAEARTGKAGEVEVSFRDSPTTAEVVIEDRGAGVPDEVQGHLFQPFAGGHAHGVGLGLALAQRITNLHGGQLRLEGRPEGGTRASVLLPLAGISATIGNDRKRA